jgi:hypothetical protein
LFSDPGSPEQKRQKSLRQSRGSVFLGNRCGFRGSIFAGGRSGRIRTKGRNRIVCLYCRGRAEGFGISSAFVRMGGGKNKPFAGNGLGNIAFCPDGTGSTNSSGSGESRPIGGVRAGEGTESSEEGPADPARRTKERQCAFRRDPPSLTAGSTPKEPSGQEENDGPTDQPSLPGGQGRKEPG